MGKVSHRNLRQAKDGAPFSTIHEYSKQCVVCICVTQITHIMFRKWLQAFGVRTSLNPEPMVCNRSTITTGRETSQMCQVGYAKTDGRYVRDIEKLLETRAAKTLRRLCSGSAPTQSGFRT
jgi:hypothetical protein